MALFAITVSAEPGCSTDRGDSDAGPDVQGPFDSDNSSWYPCEEGTGPCEDVLSDTIEVSDDVVDSDALEAETTGGNDLGAADLDAVIGETSSSDDYDPGFSDNSGWYPDIIDWENAEPDTVAPVDSSAIDDNSVDPAGTDSDTAAASLIHGLDWTRLSFCAPERSRRGLPGWRRRPSPFVTNSAG